MRKREAIEVAPQNAKIEHTAEMRVVREAAVKHLTSRKSNGQEALNLLY